MKHKEDLKEDIRNAILINKHTNLRVDNVCVERVVKLLIFRIALFEESFTALDTPRLEELAYLLLQVLQGKVLGSYPLYKTK
mgnify:CR=1 FL=1